jgi:hypothetical protein
MIYAYIFAVSNIAIGIIIMIMIMVIILRYWFQLHHLFLTLFLLY